MVYLFEKSGTYWPVDTFVRKVFSTEQKAKDALAEEFKKEVGIELSVAKKVMSEKSDAGFVVGDQYCEIPTISGESIYLTITAMEIV